MTPPNWDLAQLPILPVAGAGPAGAIIFGVVTAIQLIGKIFGLFGGGGNASKEDLSKVADGLSKAIEVSTRFAWRVAFAHGALLKLVDWLWTNGLRKLILQVYNLVRRLIDLLGRVIGPMLQAIHRLRELLNKLYDRFIRPVLSIIQQVRRYLQILHLFHIKWADKLDGILGRIQGRIIGPFLWVVRTLNGYGRWINVLITAGGVIQRPIFINSMWRYQRDWVNMFWFGQSTKAHGGATPDPVKTPAAPDVAQVTDGFRELATVDSGMFAKPAADGLAAFRAIVGV